MVHLHANSILCVEKMLKVGEGRWNGIWEGVLGGEGRIYEVP